MAVPKTLSLGCPDRHITHLTTLADRCSRFGSGFPVSLTHMQAALRYIRDGGDDGNIISPPASRLADFRLAMDEEVRCLRSHRSSRSTSACFL